MVEFSYKRLRMDYCAYVYQSGDKFSIVLIWVDDITAFADSPETNQELVEKLKRKYEIKVLGEPTLLLGIHIQRNWDRRIMMLSQKRYVLKILERAGMENLKPTTTPMDTNVLLTENTAEPKENKNGRTSIEYATRIGELLYAAHATRPDILYAMITLAQFTNNPAEEHWTAVKRIFRYLKGTADCVLTYGGGGNTENELIRYTVADWGLNAHRRSISRYVFTLGGGAIAWSSKKQGRTALSTAEAEYAAATQAVKQLIWHRNLLKELDLPQERTLILLSDNQAAISISHNPKFHARTKHIDIELHFLRDHVSEGTMKMEYIPSKDNLADLFTKSLPRPRHELLTSRIRLLEQGGVLELFERANEDRLEG